MRRGLFVGMVLSVMVEGGSATPRALKLAQRMDRLGLGDRELSRLSGVSRGTVAKARTGNSRGSTYGRLEKALDDFELETGADRADETVTVVELPDGTRVSYRGKSAEDAAKFLSEFLAARNSDG